jgi:hypothetical protein
VQIDCLAMLFTQSSLLEFSSPPYCRSTTERQEEVWLIRRWWGKMYQPLTDGLRVSSWKLVPVWCPFNCSTTSSTTRERNDSWLGLAAFRNPWPLMRSLIPWNTQLVLHLAPRHSKKKNCIRGLLSDADSHWCLCEFFHPRHPLSPDITKFGCSCPGNRTT